MKYFFFILLLLGGGYGFGQSVPDADIAGKALVAAGARWQNKTPRYASLRFKQPLAVPAADRAAALRRTFSMRAAFDAD